MFEKVLFPTDFSERADLMLDCVASFPQVREIVLLHVVRETMYPMGAQVVDRLAKESAEKTLAGAKRYLASLNREIRVTLETVVAPDIAEGIIAAAEKSSAGLVVMGARGTGVAEGVLLGSVSTRVLCRVSGTSLLFMRHRIVDSLSGKTFEKYCPLLFTRVLCPTDFSRFSEQAAALAGALEGVGEVILIHVVQDGGAAQLLREAEARIGKARDQLVAQGVRCRSRVTVGDPAAAIIRAAEEEDASVIWISSYGKGCLHDLLVGSTVQGVARNATRPVLVIRPGR